MAWNTLYTRVPGEWGELFAEWREDLEDRGRRPNTWQRYLRERVRFSEWAIAQGLEPLEVTARDIRAYIRERRQTGSGGRSIAAHLCALRRFYGMLVRDERLAANPAQAVENPRFRRPLPRVLNADLLATLLDLPVRRGRDEVGRRDTALLRTLAWAGLRASEASGLDWDHLDVTPGRGSLSVIDGKGGRDRVVPVSEPLVAVLLDYLDLRLPLGAQRAVLISTFGRRLTARRIGEVVSGYGKRIGTRVYPHLLRAQCGVEMIRAGASLPEVRAVLGHAGFDTLVPYTAVAGEEARGALERIVQQADPRHRSDQPPGYPHKRQRTREHRQHLHCFLEAPTLERMEL